MWTDIDQKLIYQTQWFDTKLTVFDRTTGKLVRNIDVGEAPAHVMTRVDTDQVHVSINGEDDIVELSPGAKQIDRRDCHAASRRIGGAAPCPLDEPRRPDYGDAQLEQQRLDPASTSRPAPSPRDCPPVSCPSRAASCRTPASTTFPTIGQHHHLHFDRTTGVQERKRTRSPTKTINLLLGGTSLANYNPITRAGFSTSEALPNETPVSPKWKVRCHGGSTLTATITIIDTAIDELVKVLPCSAGCHGVNFGAKKGGGYYAYVSSKFSNDLIVVDPDPNDDGLVADAEHRRPHSSRSRTERGRASRRRCDGLWGHGRARRAADTARVHPLGPEAPTVLEETADPKAAATHPVRCSRARQHDASLAGLPAVARSGAKRAKAV